MRFVGDQPAGPAGDLHRERLGVAGAERLHDAAGIEGLDDELARGFEGALLGLLRQPFEPGCDLGEVGGGGARSSLPSGSLALAARRAGDGRRPPRVKRPGGRRWSTRSCWAMSR